MLLVVAYDIADDRRRVRLHTALLAYGVPVQESLFECEVTARQGRLLRRRVLRLIHPVEDKVRYYTLCADCAGQIEDAQGTRRQPQPSAYVI